MRGGSPVERQDVAHRLRHLAAVGERVCAELVLEHRRQLGRLERVQAETVAIEAGLLGELGDALVGPGQERGDDVACPVDLGYCFCAHVGVLSGFCMSAVRCLDGGEYSVPERAVGPEPLKDAGRLDELVKSPLTDQVTTSSSWAATLARHAPKVGIVSRVMSVRSTTSMPRPARVAAY